jgi:hypothetical protein
MKRHLWKVAAVAMVGLIANACDVDSALDVQDPDIINPAAVCSLMNGSMATHSSRGRKSISAW